MSDSDDAPMSAPISGFVPGKGSEKTTKSTPEQIARWSAKPIQVDEVKHKAFGEFEKHTKGFGSKYLAKFGFKGRLGKKETGIVNPIAPVIRTKASSGIDVEQQVNKVNFNTVEAQDRVPLLPELSHNLTLIVESTTVEARAAIRAEELYQQHLNQQLEELGLLDQQQKDDLQKQARLEEMSVLVKALQQPQAISTVHTLLSEILEKFPEEFTEFNIAGCIPKLVFPTVATQLIELSVAVDIYSHWAPLLRMQTCRGQTRDLLSRFEAEVFFPWLSTFPAEQVQSEVLDHLDVSSQTRYLKGHIIPKLRDAIREWTYGGQELHLIVHPWLLVLEQGNCLQLVCEIVREKLEATVVTIPPNAIVPLLTPWKEVFPPSELHEIALIAKPLERIQKLLERLEVNPNSQKVEEFRLACSWAKCGIIPLESATDSLAKIFFPKWFAVLGQWVSHDSVVFPQVARWYLEWKNEFISFSSFGLVKSALTRALQIMEFAVDGKNVTGFIQLVQKELRRDSRARERIARPPLPRKLMEDELSVGEIVEQIALQQGIVYVPNPRRSRVNGKLVYSFGTQSIYFDRHLIHIYQSDSQTWSPVSIEDLVASSQ